MVIYCWFVTKGDWQGVRGFATVQISGKKDQEGVPIVMVVCYFHSHNKHVTEKCDYYYYYYKKQVG